MRIHLSDEARAFECTKEGCDKKFWTATHLKRHMAVHDNVDTHQVSCHVLVDEIFTDKTIRSVRNARKHSQKPINSEIMLY
jgi:hypothetical protein